MLMINYTQRSCWWVYWFHSIHPSVHPPLVQSHIKFSAFLCCTLDQTTTRWSKGVWIFTYTLKGYDHSVIWKCCQHHWPSVREISTLLWRHNGRSSISNHQPHNCLFNCLFRHRSKKTSKLRVTGLCVGNSPGTGEFPTQMASNAENVSIWWRHHAINQLPLTHTHTHKGPMIQSIQFHFMESWFFGISCTHSPCTDVIWNDPDYLPSEFNTVIGFRIKINLWDLD